MTTKTPPTQSKIKAVLFDFMGTCLDWHTAITTALPSSLSADVKSQFALEWRQTYFNANAARLSRGEAPEDIDITHLRTLNELLAHDKHASIRTLFTDDLKVQAVQAWHHQRAWPEVASAIRKLREQGYEVFVHANGTTRLQLDLVRYSGLEFDMLFSSQLLGVYKPALENYQRVLALIKRAPEECVLVAAHEYDLAGGRRAGMRTVYVYRWTDDIEEDQGQIKRDNDAYLLSMDGLDKVIMKL